MAMYVISSESTHASIADVTGGAMIVHEKDDLKF